MSESSIWLRVKLHISEGWQSVSHRYLEAGFDVVRVRDAHAHTNSQALTEPRRLKAKRNPAQLRLSSAPHADPFSQNPSDWTRKDKKKSVIGLFKGSIS